MSYLEVLDNSHAIGFYCLHDSLNHSYPIDLAYQLKTTFLIENSINKADVICGLIIEEFGYKCFVRHMNQQSIIENVEIEHITNIKKAAQAIKGLNNVDTESSAIEISDLVSIVEGYIASLLNPTIFSAELFTEIIQSSPMRLSVNQISLFKDQLKPLEMGLNEVFNKMSI